MPLSEFEWKIICVAAGVALSLVVYFVTRLISQYDKHGNKIDVMGEKYATKDELSKVASESEEHDKAINEIMRTYVTKDELNSFKSEFRDETKKLAADIEEIKANYLTENNFYRAMAKHDQQIDKILDILIQLKGERKNEQ